MKIKFNLIRWALPLLAVVLAAVAIRFVATGRGEQAPVVAKQTPATPPPENASSGSVAAVGVVQPSSELIAIATSVPGVVKTVNVRVGDSVKPGQLLFTLDDREAAAELRSRESSLTFVRQSLRTAEIDAAERLSSLRLYESIGDPRAMTQDELTRRRFAVQAADARLAAAKAQIDQAQAQVNQASTAVALRQVMTPGRSSAPESGATADNTLQVLQIKLRAGEFAPAMQLGEPLMTLGAVQPLHVKIDVDEADISRADFASDATLSPRGAPNLRARARFVRTEPLVVPKRSLTNSMTERVDTRVLQLVYELPKTAHGFYVGQQVEAFIAAKPGERTSLVSLVNATSRAISARSA